MATSCRLQAAWRTSLPSVRRARCLPQRSMMSDEARHAHTIAVHAQAQQQQAQQQPRQEQQQLIADPGELWRAIQARYDAAQAHKAASTFDTRTQLVQEPTLGVTFVLKVAAQLRDKPKPKDPPPPAAAAGGQGASGTGAAAPPPPHVRNPFLPPDPELLVGPLSPTHSLVLNKFNVMPYHLLVVTRAFESQADPLNAADLAATLAAMAALPRAAALAFYNCGPLSGASQPHKHVQVVPLPLSGGTDAVDGAAPTPSSSSGSGGLESSSEADQPPFGALVAAATTAAPPGTVVELRRLPFVSFAAALPDAYATPPAELERVFAQLLDAAAEAAAARGQPPEAFSYNAILTRCFAMLVPRRAESAGPVSCNSVAFAGSFFVRSEEELAYVRADPLGVLAHVGFPWDGSGSSSQQP